MKSRSCKIIYLLFGRENGSAGDHRMNFRVTGIEKSHESSSSNAEKKSAISA